MSALVAVRNTLFENRASAVGLGVFRIAYGCVLLGEVLQLIYFRRLVFGEMPFLPVPEASFKFALWAWAGVVVCLILGLHTRIACVANYVLTLATLSTLQDYEYHADYIYIGINLLLMFTPVERRMSLDALRRRWSENAMPGAAPTDTMLPHFHLDALLFVGLGLVYFDSLFWKLGQANWNHGLGIWVPASLPHNTWISPKLLNSALNRGTLMSFLSDLTMVFEGTFIALMWWRPARPILCVIGIGMHSCILLFFPIPLFGLLFLSMYLLLLPQSWYAFAGRMVRRNEPRCIVSHDASSHRWRRGLLMLEHFDVRGSLSFEPLLRTATDDQRSLMVIEGTQVYHELDAFVAAMRCHSLLWPLAGLGRFLAGVGERFNIARPRDSTTPVSRASHPSHVDSAKRAGTEGDRDRSSPHAPRLGASMVAVLAIVVFSTMIQATLIAKAPYFNDSPDPRTGTPSWLASVQRLARGYVGLTFHGMFVDGHFKGYDHIVAVTWIQPDGSETWLPLTRPSGQAGWYATGRLWVKWAFRANAPYMSIEHLKLGLRDMTAFWARQNRVDLSDARFRVLVKKYDPDRGWRRNYLRDQVDKPWSEAGMVEWKQGQFSGEIIDIESL